MSKIYFLLRKISFFAIFILLVAILFGCDNQPKEAFKTPEKYNYDPSKLEKFKLPAVTVKIPEDEAPHDVLVEWWYYTGHVVTTDGKRYGIIYVIFQNIRSNLPAIYLAHFAILDENAKDFKLEESIKQISQKDIKFGGNDGFNLKMGKWQLTGKNGLDTLKAQMSDGSYGLDIQIQDVKGIALPANGLVNYGTRVPWLSYYYERTRMAVSGTITVGDQVKQIAQGQLWFDHQWGNFATVSTWDWFSAQLDDGSELMAYKLYTIDKKFVQVLGIYVPPCDQQCTPNQFIKSVDLTTKDFEAIASGKWTSPKTGIVYPINWKVSIKNNPQIPNLELNFVPTILNPEIIIDPSRPLTYWEGDQFIQGTKNGQPISGSGFVELAGYGAGKKLEEK